MTAKTKKFDAVAESRKWREATSRELFAMNEEERFAFLRAETEKLRTKLKARRNKAARALAAH